MEFRTARLEVRPFREEDREDMLALLTDARVGKTYMLPEFRSPQEAGGLFRRLLELSRTPGRYVAGISLEGKCIGMINDTETVGSRIEMGYALLPDFWGRGYAAEALDGAMELLFAQGFEEVIAGAFAENLPSIRVMVKCGMTLLPRRDQIGYRGRVYECVYYSRKKTGEGTI